MKTPRIRCETSWREKASDRRLRGKIVVAGFDQKDNAEIADAYPESGALKTGCGETLPEAPVEETGTRPQRATLQDVSLAITSDIDAHLHADFLRAIPIQVRSLSEAIQELISDGSTDQVRIAQRRAHTLKGTANTLGVAGIASLTHHLEDILAAQAKHESSAVQMLAPILKNAVGCLNAMCDSLGGLADPPKDARAVLQQVLDWANRIDREGLSTQGDETTRSRSGAGVSAAEPKAPRSEMVIVKSRIPHLLLSVKRTCRLTGKQAKLHVSGADTLIDDKVLSGLLDPLMHILRNAIDHGIESPEERSIVGKPEIGNIWLDFWRENEKIRVRCRDDGAGFDLAAIRRKAIICGLLAPGQAVSEDTLKALVLMPNFSTRIKVTQSSGRGLGLDIVYAHVLGQGGYLTLDSEPDKGSTFELHLPARPKH